MDKALKRTFLAWHAQGLSATDIMTRHNKDPRNGTTVRDDEVADVLMQMGAKDPYRRIPQKPEIQPDMPKRFIPLHESKKHRPRLTRRQPTDAQREFHNIACGFSADGRKLLKDPSRHKLERQIVEHLERGYIQLGGITSDFDYDGTMFLAVVKRGDLT